MGTKKQLSITIDDGSQRVPITNMHGDEIGVFYFRPTDVGIIERYNKLAKDIDKIVEPLENISVDNNGEAADQESDRDAVALKEAETRLYEALNELFGGDMAGAFFGKMNPFSPVGGVFYCEKAIEAVGEFIKAQFEVEAAKMSKNAEKYTKGYGKKK